jgi:hypothetical protein
MTTQLAPDRLGLPPPLDMDLVDAGRATGWIADTAVGFRGFGDETEATHAAWVAHRALARRLARTHRERPVPVDTEPLALRRVEGKEMILASGRPIATLIRPGSDSRTGDSFGFELRIPAPGTELHVRAMAYLIYRTLRKSGIRWAMWRPEAAQVAERPMAETSVDTVTRVAENVDARPNDVAHRPSRAAWNPAISSRRGWRGLTRTASAGLPLAAGVVLALGVAAFVPIPLAAVLLGGMGVGGVMLLRNRRLR